MAKEPLIFSVVRGSLDDGTGFRTTVFFKGCNLKCLWCHNPESIDPGPQIAFYARRCGKCGSCVKACRLGACDLHNENRIDRTICTNCGECAQVCPWQALRLVGRPYGLRQLVRLLLRDKPFYDASGGGVTLSGGEPTLHTDWCGNLISMLRKREVKVAIQTNGTFSWPTFERAILPHVELVMFDVKIVDSYAHRRFTGADNTQILSNLQKMAAKAPRLLLVRMPLVPGFTSDPDNCRDLARLLGGLGITRIAPLPYNATWFHKAEAIGREPDKRLLHRSLTEVERSTYNAFFEGFELVDMKEYAFGRTSKMVGKKRDNQLNRNSLHVNSPG